MSDYISKSDVIKIIEKAIENSSDFLQHNTQIDIMFEVQELPTLDEKEIIRKTVERIISMLEQQKEHHKALKDYERQVGTFYEMKQHEMGIDVCNKAIEICKEVGGIE